MGLSVRGRAILAAISILLLQFITLPFLGDLDKAGKLYLFTFAVLLCALCFFRSVSEVRVSPVIGILVLLWLVFSVSAWQAFDSAWAFIQVAILAVYLLFLLIATHWSDLVPQFRQRFVDSLLFFGLIASVLGLYEYFHFVLLGPSRAMLIPYLLPPDHSQRIVGPYGQPNLFAVFLTLTLLAFFYRYIHRSIPLKTSFTSTLRFIPFVLVGLVFFMTGSRSGFLSASLVFSFLAWLVASGRYLGPDRADKREFLRLALCLFLSFLISKGLDWWYHSALDLSRSFGDAGMSTDARFLFWASAFLIFRDNPWLGVGLDNFKLLQNSYGPKAHEFLGFVEYEAMGNTAWTHNELLQILSEGGLVAFGLAVFLIVLLLSKIWHNFVGRGRVVEPFFLYSHLFLLPFVIQSMFSWPFRYPPLLILFFTCLGLLLSQYPLRRLRFSPAGRQLFGITLVLGLCVTTGLFYQENKIGIFKRNIKQVDNIDSTLLEFAQLANNPYSEHRVLANALPLYAREALGREDNSLAVHIVPYYERLCELEGVRWHWYNLALIYFKLDRESDARAAIQTAFELMPSDEVIWTFLHYLNVRKASRDTGRPLESFFVRGNEFDFNMLELMDE